MTQMHKVDIVNETRSLVRDIHAAGPCMSTGQIHNYLQQLSIQLMPDKSCIYHMCASFINYDKNRVSFCRTTNFMKTSEEHFAGLTVYFSLINGCKCRKEDCLHNLKNGTCTDKFMIDVIGKPFFADKYIDTNTKQR